MRTIVELLGSYRLNYDQQEDMHHTQNQLDKNQKIESLQKARTLGF